MAYRIELDSDGVKSTETRFDFEREGQPILAAKYMYTFRPTEVFHFPSPISVIYLVSMLFTSPCFNKVKNVFPCRNNIHFIARSVFSLTYTFGLFLLLLCSLLLIL